MVGKSTSHSNFGGAKEGFRPETDWRDRGGRLLDTMRNPFDDHQSSSVGRSTNPFDSLRSDGSSASDVLGGGASLFGGGVNSSTTPNEATWQDLGDLPYRRVRMYDTITWGWKQGEISKTTQLSTSSTEEQIGLR